MVIFKRTKTTFTIQWGGALENCTLQLLLEKINDGLMS